MNIKTLLAVIDVIMTNNPNAEIAHVSREFDSYRGYYQHLAMSESCNRQMSMAQFYNVLADQIGKTYHGYKGGEYTMTGDTMLFIAEYGCTGRQVVGVSYDCFDEVYYLQTSEKDYNGF